MFFYNLKKNLLKNYYLIMNKKKNFIKRCDFCFNYFLSHKLKNHFIDSTFPENKLLKNPTLARCLYQNTDMRELLSVWNNGESIYGFFYFLIIISFSFNSIFIAKKRNVFYLLHAGKQK